MIVVLTSEKTDSNLNFTTLTCDSIDEIEQLPSLDKYHTGSQCYCIDEDIIFILGSDGRWHEV